MAHKHSKLGKWTRRSFIAGGVLVGSVLLVGVGIRRVDRRDKVASLVTADSEQLLNLWVKIDKAGKITAIVPHSEMGQGVQTALTQMLADELDANWDDVDFVEAPADTEYTNGALAKGYLLGNRELPSLLTPTVNGVFHHLSNAMVQQITGGSLSVRTTGIHGMRVAGASAREMLIKAAASKWHVNVSELSTSNSEVLHKISGKRASYAELVEDAAKFVPSAKPKLKTINEFTLMGKKVPRRDLLGKVKGTAKFGIDAQLPNMHYAAVKTAPVFGAKVKRFNQSNALNAPQVTDVVNLDNAVAVVATSYWHAQNALNGLDIKWTKTEHDTIDSEKLENQFVADLRRAHEKGDSTDEVKQGDIESAFKEANRIIEASYQIPFLAHACMEPLNATVSFNNERCSIWTGTQNPLGAKYDVAKALDIDAENIDFHQHFMGGGFGRRSSPDYIIQAARIALQVQKPVKLIWSRQEDTQQDRYRPAVVSQFRGALNSSGQVTAWDNIYHEKHEPVEAPIIPYTINAKHIHHIDSPTHVPFGPWRSVDHSAHGFFTEVFIDELATVSGQDPYQYRKSLLTDKPRFSKLLDEAASRAGWGRVLPDNIGMGIAIHQSFGSIVAQVVEVSYQDKQIKVDKVTCVGDPGFAVAPDGFKAQMESGIIYGLSAALYGEITIKDGAVQQSAFHDYPVVRMPEAPLIDVYIVNSGEPWGGAGEPATPVIAPALINAIYQATGERIRRLPITQHQFKA